MRGWLIVGLLLVVGAEAQACQRCGLFGRNCRYQTYTYSHVAVAPVVQYQQPDVFVVQNNYPQPNGAVGLLAQQGATTYGLQAASSAYFVNPAETLRQAAELAKAANATAQIGLTGYTQTAQAQLSLQAAIAEPLVRGQAAAQVLTAAGLAQTASSQASSLAIKISRNADGTWAITQADAAAVTQHASAATAAPAAISSLVVQYCADCHGAGLAEPKGGLVIDRQELSCGLALRAYRAVMSGKMPQGVTLDEATKSQLSAELIELAKQE